MRASFLSALLGVFASFGAAQTSDEYAGATETIASNSNCRCFPGDPCWPSTQKWGELNTTRRILESCDPFMPVDSPCQIGAYVRYAINVTEPADIIAGIEFAKKNNVRLVIRNTGHDFLGKSSGPGSLSLWTHHLKDIEYIPEYKSEAYHGPALKVAAGVQGIEAYTVADKNGVVVVGGVCPSIGIAGGYTQGGGHSILMGKYGLGADQTLEFEVVTGEGKHVNASKTENTDLYWALSGGGGGTYGVVTSMTVKAHKDAPMTVTQYSFRTTTGDTSMDNFYDALDFLHQMAPECFDRGGYIFNIYSKGSLSLGYFFGPEWTKEDTATFFQPWVERLESLGLQYSLNITEYPGYLTAYNTIKDIIAVGNSQPGGRIIPKDTLLNKRAQFNQVVKHVVEDGATLFEIVAHPTLEVAGNPDNAVLPAWRDSAIFFITTTPWDDTAEWSQALEGQKTITRWGGLLHELVPESGAYLNEADVNEPNFQREFYGENYARLLFIKNRYDPAGIFYALTAVGSDTWTQSPDGRLCKTNP
ncbi:unnamed protein product [Tuber aestivum]|uniref:FAD-binding PCMH-type domain-containing protein n=1 Tax=Tuber aestivum TaxID=59557 RepID=A0A292PVG3_9PEZI|nr:unnamed protein product [Tuber aestivum]